MLGIEMLEQTLRIVRLLRKINCPMSGVIIRIEGVGHSFYWGASREDMQNASLHFQANKLDYAFEVVAKVTNIPAKMLMNFIHALNDYSNLPGLVKYLEQQGKAA